MRNEGVSFRQIKFIFYRFNVWYAVGARIFENYIDGNSLRGLFFSAVEGHVQTAFLAGIDFAAWIIYRGAIAGIHDVNLNRFGERIGKFIKHRSPFSFFYRPEFDPFFIPGHKGRGGVFYFGSLAADVRCMAGKQENESQQWE